VGVRITSWNLLHGMAIPPAQNGDAENLTGAMQKLDGQIHSDIYGFQEVDHFLARSTSRPQMRDIAETIGARDWAMAPSIIGTPGEKWRPLRKDEPEIITNNSSHQELMHESYGIGIVSKIPVVAWHRLNLGNSPIGMPLVVPGDETGKGRPRFIYVRDEPRVAIAAVLENGWVIINTHLSFVPGINFAQLRKIKRWAKTLGAENNCRVIIMGDLNLPKNLPVLASDWISLVQQNTYPSWGAKIQFDYILAQGLQEGERQPLNFSSLAISKVGVSDHLPLAVEIFN
jgi:endonuclease/exonuclease/phosphatase family metal-dependent hydrolase